MACSPWLFVQRARMYLTSDDLAHYLGIVKSQPDRAGEVRETMIRAIAERERFERECVITRDEYAEMCRKEAALRQPAPVAVVEQPTPVEVVEQPIPVDVGWNSELATELFGKVEVVG